MFTSLVLFPGLVEGERLRREVERLHMKRDYGLLRSRIGGRGREVVRS